ncbi:hypothetical protein FACS1894171_0560 [Clostridia bacterium]|nr:hypothetical protein FACS1894171_0560 [Clostridia bacterium]
MDIRQFAAYDGPIIIQSHDVPDGDSIGSAFALQRCLKAFGAEASIIYGGKARIEKPNLLAFTEALGIEISHAAEIPENALLITADCQYGAGNVTKFPCARFAVIDHHRPEIPEGENVHIRPGLASCATVMWDLTRRAGYDAEADYAVRNALFYGLFTDTNGLSELRHPLDRDLAEVAYDAGLLRRLKNRALRVGELAIVSHALTQYDIIDGIALFRAAKCDPNALGFASDIAIQVDRFDCCVVYCPTDFGLKLSVRSGVREIMASELAAFICRDAGNGGGGIEKAGGFLNNEAVAKHMGVSPEEYLRRRVEEYIGHYDHIYAGKTPIDFDAMPRFRKRRLTVGFAKTTDVFPARTKITVRTLEGDVDAVAAGELYLMIGIYGEVYPILREKFERSYAVSEEPYSLKTEYEPTAVNRATGEKCSLLPFARACVSTGEKTVRAAQIKRDTKIFSHWDTEKYFSGAAGDYLVAAEGEYDDCYIVRENIFLESYEGD